MPPSIAIRLPQASADFQPQYHLTLGVQTTTFASISPYLLIKSPKSAGPIWKVTFCFIVFTKSDETTYSLYFNCGVRFINPTFVFADSDQMGFKKGQAALDFLMTYGWAIALVVIIAAVLFSLGIFDVSNFVGNKASGFSGVAVTGWQLGTSGQMDMKVSNQVGQRINVTSINVTIAGTTKSISGATLAPGETSKLLSTAPDAFGTQTSGTGYTAKVVIDYIDMNADFNYTTSGTLTGKVP